MKQDKELVRDCQSCRFRVNTRCKKLGATVHPHDRCGSWKKEKRLVSQDLILYFVCLLIILGIVSGLIFDRCLDENINMRGIEKTPDAGIIFKNSTTIKDDIQFIQVDTTLYENIKMWVNDEVDTTWISMTAYHILRNVGRGYEIIGVDAINGIYFLKKKRDKGIEEE